MKYKRAKVYVHIGTPWPAGRTYLIDSDLALKFRMNPEQFKPETYGFLRKESHDLGSRIKVVIKAEGLDYQERYFTAKESALAKKWLKAEANKGLKELKV